MTRRTVLSGSFIAVVLSIVVAGQALAASTVPFSWTLAFHNPYFGRDMISNTGTFCEWYHSTDSTYSTPKNYTGSAEKYTYISLWTYTEGGLIEKVGVSVAYPNSGSQYVYCWRGFIPGQTYAFKFEKSAYSDGVWIYAAGNVQDH